MHVSNLQALVAACGKPFLAIGMHAEDVARAQRQRRVAWIEIERMMGVDRSRIVFAGTKTPDLVFDKPIPDALREAIEEPGWVSPDDVLASLGVE